MTKQNIEVQDFEDKKTQANKRFTRFKTDKGWMSCFSAPESEKLKKFEGKTASVEVRQAGNFSNIEKVYGDADSQTTDDAEVEVIKPSSTGNVGVSTDRVDRAKALEIAINYYKGQQELVAIADAIATAQVYFKYITEGV